MTQRVGGREITEDLTTDGSGSGDKWMVESTGLGGWLRGRGRKSIRGDFFCEHGARGRQGPRGRGTPMQSQCALSSESGLNCNVQFSHLQNGATTTHLAGRERRENAKCLVQCLIHSRCSSLLPELGPAGQVPFHQQEMGSGEDIPGGRNGMSKTCLCRKDEANG